MLRVRGLYENTTPEFRRKLARVAQAVGTDPDFLAAVISFETGGSFRADEASARSTGVGLLQFTKIARDKLGVTRDALVSMSPVEQLDVVERYLRPYAGRVERLDDLYLAVIAPAFVGERDAQRVIYAAPSDEYDANKELDLGAKGGITVEDAVRSVRRTYANAIEAGPAQAVEARSANISILGAALFVGSAWAAIYYLSRWLGRRTTSIPPQAIPIDDDDDEERIGG